MWVPTALQGVIRQVREERMKNVQFWWDELQDGDRTDVLVHQVSRVGDRFHIFGNDRMFIVPPRRRLVDAFIALVPHGRYPLPEGRVDVLLRDGTPLEVGQVLPPEVYIVRVETPLSKGQSNWAGIELVFENT